MDLPSDVRIVPIDVSSRLAAVELLSRFFREEGFRQDAATIDHNLGLLIADDHHWGALAVTGIGRAVGVVTATTMLYVEWGRLGEIGDLYVLTGYRGRGIARSLVRAATDWCRGADCSAVSVTITPEGEAAHGLSAFYAALGFVATGRTASVLELSG